MDVCVSYLEFVDLNQKFFPRQHLRKELSAIRNKLSMLMPVVRMSVLAKQWDP